MINSKQIIFYPAVVISIIFSAFLFYNFGNTIPSKSIWLSVSIIIQLFQIYTLRQYFFKDVKKDKIRAFIKYSIITLFSLIATITFGLYDINKTIMSNADKEAEIEAVELQISQKEKLLNNFDKNDIIKKQIENLQGQIEGTAYWKHIINRNINELTLKLNTGNDDLISSIIALKKKKALLIKNSVGTKRVFEILGDSFLIGEKAMRVIFLLFVAIILEIIVFTSGDFNIKDINNKEKPKKKVGRPKKKKRIEIIKETLF